MSNDSDPTMNILCRNLAIDPKSAGMPVIELVAKLATRIKQTGLEGLLLASYESFLSGLNEDDIAQLCQSDIELKIMLDKLKERGPFNRNYIGDTKDFHIEDGVEELTEEQEKKIVTGFESKYEGLGLNFLDHRNYYCEICRTELLADVNGNTIGEHLRGDSHKKLMSELKELKKE